MILATATALVGVVAPLFPARAARRSNAQSCHRERKGVVYSTKGVISRSAGPIPCLVRIPKSTGAGESHIAATKAGTIAYQAQGAMGDGESEPPVHVVLTTDFGRTWRATGADVSGSMPSPIAIDNVFYRDRLTDRLFWVVYGVSSNPPRTTMGVSDNGGRSWRVGSTPCCTEGENPRMLAAKPRVGRTGGYPNVLYYCTNTGQVGGLVFLTGARVCYKSLDGGTTWDSGRPLLLKPGGNFPQCAGQGERFDSLDGYYPIADGKGRLYLQIRCGLETESFVGPAPYALTTSYILRSDDEMGSWKQVGEAPPLPDGYGAMGYPYKEELRADSAGNLYLVRGTGDPTYALYLWVSKNGGKTWSRAIKVSIPGTQSRNSPTWQVDVASPGEVAVVYAGVEGSQPPAETFQTSAMLNMYLVETDTALRPNVVFRGAMLNDPKNQTAYEFGGTDYTDVTIGPDGVARAAFPRGYVGWLARGG